MPSPVPARTAIGIYLTSIFDIDPGRDSFLADFYVWTNSRANAPDPLATVTFPRARSQATLYEWKEKIGDRLWSVRKYRCEILNDWVLGNFPFDSHILAIVVGPDFNQYTPPSYLIDEKNSGMATHIALSGWQLSDFEIFGEDVAYNSNFGDPRSSTTYKYHSVVARFELRREAWQPFFKLMAGAYLAAGAALLGCYMNTIHPPLFSGRMALQIGCLFSAIISHREISNAVGRNDVFTLPDTLHLLCYLLIFTSLVITLRSRRLNEINQEKRAIRHERRVTLFLTFLFLVLNVTFVLGAAATAPHSDMLRIVQVGD